MNIPETAFARITRRLFFLCWGLFGSLFLFSQDFQFEHFFLEDGLPSYSVLSIAQDSTGFMWFGTAAGLCRFDGRRFKTYKEEDFSAGSDPINNITAIFTDSKGQVWVGNKSGPHLYDVRKDRFIRIQFKDSAMASVFCFYEDSRGSFWIGTSNGLYKMSSNHPDKTLVFPVKSGHSGIAGRFVRAITEDRKGQLWVGTEKGITRIQQLKDQVFRFDNFNLVTSKPSAVTALCWDAENRNLWIGTQNTGILAYQLATKRFTHYYSTPDQSLGLVNNNIRCITADKQAHLWIGTQEGISILNPKTGEFRNLYHKATQTKSLSQSSVYSIFQDRNGSFWVGTYFGGLNYLPIYPTPFSTLRNTEQTNSLSNNVVSRIIEDQQQNLWIGTEGGGLNYFNQNSGRFTLYDHKTTNPRSLGSNLVKEVFQDRDGYIWVGTHGGGINVLDKNRQFFTKYVIDGSDPTASEVSSIIEDQSGILWIASNTGLHRFIKENGKILGPAEALPGQPDFPLYLYKDRKGDLWIGAAGGLYKYQDQRFRLVDSSGLFNCFAEDADGALWAGGIGLTRITGPNLAPLQKRHAILESYRIRGILQEPSGDFWLSSSQGLLHFYPSDGHYQRYTELDGLAGNGFNFNAYLKDHQGVFYFGGFNGINYFKPSTISVNKRVPKLVLTGLKLQNRTITVQDETGILPQNPDLSSSLSLRYDQNIFTIEFALLNYVKSNKNKYAYQLAGFDKSWNETSQPTATYTNLPPGDYRLLIKAANNDGYWGPARQLRISVSPPFWRTWWAYSIYTLLIAAVLFIIARFFFMRELLKREEILHTAKLNFFTNVSHEIRTHLTLIMSPVERILKESEEKSYARQQLIQVNRNIHRLLKLVSELMDFRKAESNHLVLHTRTQNLVPFLKAIHESFQEFAQARLIHCSFVYEQPIIAVEFDAEQLNKVFFNLMSNALKFTPEGGNIELKVQERNNNAIITVTDNGRGIAPPYIEKLFTNFFQVADHGLQNTGYGIGLALAKNIVTLHKGSIAVESITAEGSNPGKTKFTVTLTVSKQEITEPTDISLEMESYLSANKVSDNRPPTSAVSAAPGSPQILIVEDNPDMAALIRDCLFENYLVTISNTGGKGWEEAVKTLPDLIISDVMMPEMNGYELCHQLKTDQRTSHIPVILLTAKDTLKDQITGLQQGADIYLSKPFSNRLLFLSVQNLLAAKERMRRQFSKTLIRLNTLPKEEEPFQSSKPSASLDTAFLNELSDLIERHMEDPGFGVDMLSKKMAMSTPILYKKLRALTNMSVNEFIKLQRFKKAATLILQNEYTINEIAYMVGFEDRKYFSREFKKYFGQLPSEFTGTHVK